METALVDHMSTGRLIRVELLNLVTEFLSTTCGIYMWLFVLLQKDIDVMTELGVDGYRFSLAWSRIAPSMYTLIHACIYEYILFVVKINLRSIWAGGKVKRGIKPSRC